MIAGASFLLRLTCVDSSDVLRAARFAKVAPDYWVDQVVEHHDEYDDSIEGAWNVDLPVHSLDELREALAIADASRPMDVYLCVSIANPSIDAWAHISKHNGENTPHATIDQRRGTETVASNVITEIEAKCAQLRTMVMFTG